ncbi:hypothetical protein ABBQ38_000129 [Trebouxia sp. C0009 RCD-2024]
MGKGGLTHGIKYQARSLVAVSGSNQHSRWLAGTNALREENVIQLLEFNPETDSIKVLASYLHGQEIWHLAPHPQDAQILATISNHGGASTAALWNINAKAQLEKKAELTAGNGIPRSVVWHAQRHNEAISIEDGRWRLWNIDSTANMTGDVGAGDLYTLWGGAWDPHDLNRLVTAGGNGVQVWDVRSLKKTAEIPDAHLMPVRDIDFAHQQQHRIVSAGDDCKVCIWDLRALGASATPLLELGGHSHWVWQAKYNPHHDSLLLSASSDSLVNLWHTPISAGESSARGQGAPRGPSQTGQKGFGKEAQDGLACTYDDHEDSVYGVAWSMVDPWTFASLSYDGRLVVNRVPSQTKYKILI